MAEIEEQTDAATRDAALKVWVTPQIITYDARNTGSDQLPTYVEATVPTDRPS